VHDLVSQDTGQRRRVQRIDERGVVAEYNAVGRHGRNRAALLALQPEQERAKEWMV